DCSAGPPLLSFRQGLSASLRRHLARRLSLFPLEPASTQLYTLSLLDALPISPPLAWISSSMFRQASLAPPCEGPHRQATPAAIADRKSTRLNSSHVKISYAVFCLKKNIRAHPEVSLC